MNENKGIILVFSTALISGIAIFINQFGVKVVNPYIFAGLKNIVVALLLFSAILFLKEWKEIKNLKIKQWLTLLSIGIIGGSIPFLLFFKGLSMTTGAEASFIHKTMLVYVVFMALFILKEKMNKGLIIGIILLLVGNALLLKIVSGLSFDRGDLLIFIATLFWAVEQIISKRLVSTISPRIVAWGRMFLGFLFIVAFWGVTGQIQLIGTLNLVQIGWVLVSAAILFGYVITWYTGIKYVRISVAVAILALGAPITSLLQLIQGKDLAVGQIGGILLSILGVIFVLGISKVIQSVKSIKKLVHVGT